MPTDLTIIPYYNDVSRTQHTLSDKEEYELFESYNLYKKQLHIFITKTPITIQQLKIFYFDLMAGGKSPAKLDSSYNAKKKGHNKQVSDRLQIAFLTGDFTKISFSLLTYYKAAQALVEPRHIKEFKALKTALLGIEEKILHSTLMAAIKIADRYASNIFGIEVKDAIQEANKGILESIEKYNPNYVREDGQRIKFITYAYKNATKKVKEYIMNQSRLVRLPRNKLEKIFLIIEATRRMTKPDDILGLSQKANEILAERKERTLLTEEKITEEEVNEAIELLGGNSIPLDYQNSFTGDESSRPKTLGDLLPDEKTPNPEEHLLIQSNKRDLIEECSRNLNDLEFTIIYYKYLQTGDERSLKEVQTQLKLDNKNLSRERINQIKKTAFQKLKGSNKFKTLLMEGIR